MPRKTAQPGEESVSGTQSLDRGLAILFAIAESRAPGLSVADCAQALDLSKATTQRMLQTLTRRGLLAYEADSSAYTLGPATLVLGAQYLRRMDIRRIALPHMKSLAAATHETTHLGVLRGTNVVYIELVENDEPVRIFSRIGDALPAYATATGKALLAWLSPEDRAAHLPETLVARTARTITDFDTLEGDLLLTKARGYAVDLRENREEVTGYGAPIFDHDDKVVAAVAVGGPSARVTADMEPSLTRELRRAAQAISRELGSSLATTAPST